MEAYRKWVRANRQFVSSLETCANALTWLLPERFTSSEIGAEFASALVGLVTALNQHIIDIPPVPPPRNVAWSLQSHIQNPPICPESVFPWSLCISAVKELEVLLEVVAEHYAGKDKKWSFLAGMEAAKASLRLILLHKSGYKMLIDGGTTDNVDETCGSPDMQSLHGVGHPEGSRAMPSSQSYPHHATWNQGGRGMEGRALWALQKFGETIQRSQFPSQQPSLLFQPLKNQHWCLSGMQRDLWENVLYSGRCF